jgi:hypothetical protein
MSTYHISLEVTLDDMESFADAAETGHQALVGLVNPILLIEEVDSGYRSFYERNDNGEWVPYRP